MILILTTYPDKKSAITIAKELITKKFAACINIIKLENSIYLWKGKIETKGEYLLLIKTTENNYSIIEKSIKQNHPYEVPEILCIEIKEGHQNYLKWINSSAQKPQNIDLDLIKKMNKNYSKK